MSEVNDKAKETLAHVENAIAAHNSGSLTPSDLHRAREAAQATVDATEEHEPQGSPVADSGDGQGSTAGSVQAPEDDDIDE